MLQSLEMIATKKKKLIVENKKLKQHLNQRKP